MAKTKKNRAQLVAATANRLRLIQADFADQTLEVRQGYLSEEVQRVLGTLTPEERDPFLDELRERFPTWDGNDRSRSDRGGGSLTDHREWQDASFVLERLIELSQSLPEKQKNNLIDRLEDAGLAPKGEVRWPKQAVDQLNARLKLQDGESVDPLRVLEMAICLADLADRLDVLGWQIWRQIAPRSSFRAVDRLQNTMRRHAIGQADVPLSRNVEDLRHLTASLLSSISQIGMQLAQRYRVLQPQQIEELVKTEEKGFVLLVNFETRCWRKYVQLSRDLDDAIMDREVKQIIQRFVERTIRAR